MADSNSTAPNNNEVGQRLHQLTLDFIAIHELAIELSENPKKGYLQTAVTDIIIIEFISKINDCNGKTRLKKF